MDGKLLARLGAIVFVAIVITATAIEMTRKDDALTSPPVRAIQPADDPLREGQLRCQELGQKAADDPQCLRVWSETRARFLGRTRAPAAPASNSGEGR
ncbi:putative entry exclusion protein TrbK-alt [Nitrobacter sp.]|uniref:putative entry exclusion protein TrbK-alt n=1 Tax=Nitrobacter sp. TaxID=29420 RepID=UPI0029CAC3B8|nr:putative entry exclusion protein TrbK-alt [Nitrobacter sp.]